MIYEKRDFELAQMFCAIALGADEYYRELQKTQNTGDGVFRVEGLVPVNFTGVDPIKVDDWRQVFDDLDKIYDGYEQIADITRRNYMLQQVGSFRKVCRWVSGRWPISFREIVAETMFVNENPVGSKIIQKEYEKMDHLLKQAGFLRGNLKERVKSWHRSRELSNSEEVKKVIIALLKEAKERTLRLGFNVINNFNIEVKLVHGVPFNAYCDYHTCSVQVNGDVPYTVDELKHLVCHEAFPGHMTHMAVRQKLLEEGRVPKDAGLVLTNTASSPIFEGLADNGMAVLNWDEGINDRICKVFNRVNCMCNVNASHYMHCAGRNAEQTAEYLRKNSFSTEAQIASRLRYMSYPFRKAYMYPYWRGWDAVSTVWESLKEREKSDFLRYIYENMHSVDTLLQYREN